MGVVRGQVGMYMFTVCTVQDGLCRCHRDRRPIAATRVCGCWRLKKFAMGRRNLHHVRGFYFTLLLVLSYLVYLSGSSRI